MTSELRSPSLATVEASGGAVWWTNPEFVYGSENARAYASVPALSTTHTLFASRFSFDIPTGSTILGVTATIEARCATSAASIVLDWVKLRKADATLSNNKGTAVFLATSDTVYTFGGAADLWGLGLTPTDVNDGDFGIEIKATNQTGTARQVDIDHVTLTVEYQAPVVQGFTRETALTKLIQRFAGEDSDLTALARNFRAIALWADIAKDIWALRNQTGFPTVSEWPEGTLVVVNGDLYIQKGGAWVKFQDVGNTGFMGAARWGMD